MGADTACGPSRRRISYAPVNGQLPRRSLQRVSALRNWNAFAGENNKIATARLQGRKPRVL